MNEAATARPWPRKRPLALVLQGGGALGAYQTGVYAALCEQDLAPFWIAGTSIGAINAALIAGNAPDCALERLDAFWTEISTPDPLAPPDSLVPLRQAYNFWSAQLTAAAGQPGFFRPRLLPPLAPVIPEARIDPAAISFYDTSPLKATLERLVDFDRINSRAIKLSLGAVDVETGETVYFDNHRQKLGPEHVMASGALPPAFPPVEIEGRLYWDGGIVSNTPLDAVLDKPPGHDLLVLMVDLWDPRGKPPTNLIEMQARLKNIAYASRSSRHVQLFNEINRLRGLIHDLHMALPERERRESEKRVSGLGCPHQVDILHLVYREAPYELASKDYEFSRSSVARHRAEGYAQATGVLTERGWCAPAPEPGAVRILEAAPLPSAVPR
jgi:NTE family protein